MILGPSKLTWSLHHHISLKGPWYFHFVLKFALIKIGDLATDKYLIVLLVYSTCQLQGPLLKKFEFPTNTTKQWFIPSSPSTRFLTKNDPKLQGPFKLSSTLYHTYIFISIISIPSIIYWIRFEICISIFYSDFLHYYIFPCRLNVTIEPNPCGVATRKLHQNLYVQSFTLKFTKLR